MALIDDARHCYRDWRLGGRGFFRAALKCRTGGRAEVSVPLPNGFFANIRPRDSDLTTLRQVFIDDEYALIGSAVNQQIRAVYDAIVASGRVPVIIDAGANIGAASLWFAGQFPKAAIVAIEPDPSNANLLRRNLAALNNSIVLEAAIGSEPGFVRLSGPGASWAVQTARDEQGCRVVTVQDALGEIPNGVLFVVKVDIEGFESDLFASNTGWIDSATVIYIEPHDMIFPGRGTSRSFQAEFGRRDFEIHMRGENLIYVKRKASSDLT